MSSFENARSTAELTPFRRNPGRLAWTILIMSFLVFLGLLATVQFAIRTYRAEAVVRQDVTIEVIRGTTLIRPFASASEFEASTHPQVTEGDAIRTTERSEAVLWLFDGSNAHLWPNSNLLLNEIQKSRFDSRKVEIVMSQQSGNIRYEIAPLTTNERTFVVELPEGQTILREGSYSILVGPEQSEVSVRLGSASVSANGQAIELLAGERSIVRSGEPPSVALSAARDLVTNGDFGRGLQGWQIGNRAIEDNKPGTVSLILEDGRHIAVFERRESNRHGETFIHQQLDVDVRDFQSLRLSLDVKVMKQSLSGGGWVGSEYPVMVLVRYRDAFGSENTWFRGYYIHNDENHPVTSGQSVTAGGWRSDTTELFSPQHVFPKPTHLLWVEVQGSGWEYHGAVTDLRIIAE